MDKATYEMTLNDESTDGVFAISIVDKPAIQSDFVLLSKDEKVYIELQLEKLVDKKRQVVCGPALIPDILIERENYNIIFSKDTIRKISENFLINNYKDNVTLQHQLNVNKIYMVESWIVEDPTSDKSTTLGMDVPAGTWMVSFKIQDEALWLEYLASGILKGFSIEGNFSKEEVKMEEFGDEISVHDLPILDIMLSLDYTVADLNSFYVWKYGDSEHCPACQKLAGKVMTLRKWAKLAIPRVPTGEQMTNTIDFKTDYPYTRSPKSKKTGPVYGTFCENNCHCKLVRIIRSK